MIVKQFGDPAAKPLQALNSLFSNCYFYRLVC